MVLQYLSCMKKFYILNIYMRKHSCNSLGVNPNENCSLVLLIALASHEWLHLMACLHCASYSKSKREAEMKHREIIYWVVTDMQAVCLSYPQIP